MEERKNRGIKVLGGVIAFIFVLSVLLSFFILNRETENKTALIYSDGELIRSIELDDVKESFTIRVDTDGGYNIIGVEAGKICVLEASCPDKVCVKTGHISSSALPIACLPNKLIIKIESENENDVPDAVVG